MPFRLIHGDRECLENEVARIAATGSTEDLLAAVRRLQPLGKLTSINRAAPSAADEATRR